MRRRLRQAKLPSMRSLDDVDSARCLPFEPVERRAAEFDSQPRRAKILCRRHSLRQDIEPQGPLKAAAGQFEPMFKAEYRPPKAVPQRRRATTGQRQGASA